MKTSELTGAALDWAVAKCEGIYFENLEEFEMYAGDYSTDWAQGGPIIEREKIALVPSLWIPEWTARIAVGQKVLSFDDRHPLIAAMRCYVASKLGDTVDVPAELTGELK